MRHDSVEFVEFKDRANANRLGAVPEAKVWEFPRASYADDTPYCEVYFLASPANK